MIGAAIEKGNGAEWISENRTFVSEFGCRLANMLDEWRGIHNLSKECLNKKVDWLDDRYIEITTYKTFSTYDDDSLTALVFLAHEHRIRVEIEAARSGILRLCFSPRNREGGFWEKHPSLTESYEKFTRRRL